jgi:predicted transcriptional regulator
MLNLQKNNYGLSGNSSNNFNSNIRAQSNVNSSSQNSDNANLQVYNVIKEICRKNGKVTRDDILQAGEQKLRDRSKVDKCINNLLSEGFIMEEDDFFSVISNYTG